MRAILLANATVTTRNGLWAFAALQNVGGGWSPEWVILERADLRRNKVRRRLLSRKQT
jgi:hypothetical protein